ncbi:NADP-dependent oxidoreductase domain-containing protein [Scheffersomyces coipomensis]|uniref:NADP-dependent oxidoreductase domain-containing protein n=1 Tax=Scheffersomyces coipomensis TaxID=1788519 RepID=UPI00315DADAC
MSLPEIPHVKLGDSGLSVSRVIAGCMSYGDKSWAQWVLEDEEKVMTILKKCYDVGIRTFDTADIYSNGKSEILLGKFLKKYNIKRDRVVILTKLFNPVNDQDYSFRLQKSGLPDYEYINSKGLSRKHVFDAVQDSVRRLGTYIDVLQIHRLDRTTPKHEIMKALNDVILAGHTRYIGSSSMKAVEFAQLQFIADKNGWFKFISMQNYYNLLYREEEREMNAFCDDNIFGKVGLIPWSPIAMGVLARPLNTESQNNRNAKTESGITHLHLGGLSGNDAEIVNRVEKLAKKHGVSMVIISTAWVISKGTCPIVGLNSIERVEEIVQATHFKLTPEEIEYLEEPYEPKNYSIF